MKQVLSTFLLTLMLIAGGQPTLALHFCGEKLQSVKILNKQGDKSCCDGGHHEEAADADKTITTKSCCSLQEVQLSTDNYQHQQTTEYKSVIPFIVGWLTVSFVYSNSNLLLCERLRPDYPPNGFAHANVDILTAQSVLII